MYTKKITIPISETFPMMSNLIEYVASELQKELNSLPDFPKINKFQEVRLVNVKRTSITYVVKYGQVGSEGMKEENI